ncbi:MAG TPA: UDP-N-acetylmuramoyl-tripeptide--D-alanyl-D-alanine ligase, partial [Bacteroidales bacterium]|nr:UDP-N-acetylmuramoyl-tripeptide--D-alanyl-D-alanine ligase [Bacteroidales bacterium]
YNIFLKHHIINTDSRNILQGSIFWALKGEYFDGNAFIKDALNKGAAYAITDNYELAEGDKRIIFVKDTLIALQALAAMHRSNIKAKVIGITGTNGKTTTKELIKEILLQKYNVVASKGNFNNHIGAPLTILSANLNTEFLIVEMGANHPGEIADLCIITKPNFGIITNIGKAHLEGFKNVEIIKETKKALYDYVGKNNGTLFINSDNPLLLELAGNYSKITYGSSVNCNCRVINLSKNYFPEVKWKYFNNEGYAKTKLFGQYNFENIAAAICIGCFFEVSASEITFALENYLPTANRSQYIETKKNTLILDAYNANPSSMVLAIKNFAEANFENKAIILGDMLELGDYTIQEHQNIINVINKLNFKKVFLIGEIFNLVNKSLGNKYVSFLNTYDACEWLKKHNLEGYTVLLKASRKMQLETLTECL